MAKSSDVERQPHGGAGRVFLLIRGARVTPASRDRAARRHARRLHRGTRGETSVPVTREWVVIATHGQWQPQRSHWYIAGPWIRLVYLMEEGME
ncbi:hypothetical protein EVAR_41422_1 [Eumeta japonica]|uniref:Uncharacterized protein n=1 Tax=Eumeta variegata TaxID=151549 RepID=A0A4C1W6B2_EUMVA|nr:hypothetical protein EVAR_41422_1 [Eumeta japonica]